MEEPLYKIGDVVKIKQFSLKDRESYRFGLNEDMVNASGKTFEIIDVSDTTAFPGTVPDDGFKYTLKGSGWNWASFMFEKSSKKPTKSKKSKIKISFSKKRKIKFNFSL